MSRQRFPSPVIITHRLPLRIHRRLQRQTRRPHTIHTVNTRLSLAVVTVLRGATVLPVVVV